MSLREFINRGNAAQTAVDRAVVAAITNCDDALEYVFKEVIADRGGHGDFLKAFGMAFIRADFENRKILRPAAEALVSKYNLTALLPGGKDVT